MKRNSELEIFCARVALAQSNIETYPVDPASEEQKGVPKGEILKFTFADSKIFPGTSRENWYLYPCATQTDSQISPAITVYHIFKMGVRECLWNRLLFLSMT